MYIRPFLVSDAQSPPLKQPVEAGLDNVPAFSQSAAVTGISLRDQRLRPLATQRLSDLRFGIVRPIRQQKSDLSPSRASGTLNGGALLNECHRRFGIMDVRGRVSDGPGDSCSVGQQMSFRTCFATIRRVRAGVRPPKTARTEQLSSTATSRFNSPACPNSSNNNCQICPHSPDSCQSRSRRQHVIPDPQAISWGRYSHGVPVLSTNKIPVKQARSETRGRPPFGLARSSGSNGAIRSQSSSGNNGFAMRSALTRTRQKSPLKINRFSKSGKDGFVRAPNTTVGYFEREIRGICSGIFSR
jgi:hypothetical protein